jgi:long-chain acyl-CoA synthetase
MDTTAFKRFIYQRFMPVGTRLAELRFEGKKPSPGWRLLYWLGWLFLFRALKDRLGVSRLRSASTGGAALGPDVFRFFHAIGVPLRQIYGQTEISGISCIHRGDAIRFHTVGKPIPGTEVRISETGEILSRSRAVFIGYYKNEDATREALSDGWLRSGDAGYFSEEGQLVVIDRIKDVLRLADGTQFSPQFIENRLKFSPYVKEAVVIGKDRPFLTALVCIDRETTGKWAEARKLSYTTYTDLSAKRDVYDLIQREIDGVNQTLPKAARIRKFVLLYKELDADDEELTRTRKVRRAFVEQRYASIIAALYGEEQHIAIDTEIRFQDGKTARIQADLAVRTL